MTKKSRYNLMIIPHTHWDREWYQTFQGFRFRLVKMMDKLLNVLENNEKFKHFTLDGQTVILEDYLEIRPENEKRLKKFVQSGKLLIGPWYVLADEFLVSGESLVRNLIFGDKISQRFGSRMEIGYLPDQFGHSSAIPKILSGAGINCAVIYRGVGKKIKNSEFIWQSQDGSSVLAIFLPCGYASGRDLPLDKEKLLEKLNSMADNLIPYAKTEYLLIMNGGDHQEAQAEIPELLESIKNRLPYNYEISNLCEAKDRIFSKISLFDKYKGEFRSPERSFVLPGTLSTRIYLKQACDEIETMLSTSVEPLSVFADIMGLPYSKTYLDIAWKNLLQNQAHDSISGCSIDEVHKEMETRFNSTREIALNVQKNAIKYISNKIGITGETGVLIFNPVTNKRTDIAEFEIENKNNWSIFDKDGNELPSYRGNKRIEFLAKDVPGFGFKTFYLKKGEGISNTELVISKNSIENKYFRVNINKNGSINIFDKISKQFFKNCCKFEDGGDAGDEYNYSAPQNDTIVKKPFFVKSQIEKKGSLKLSMKILLKYRLPEYLNKDRKSRANRLKEYIIINRISLISLVPRIEFETTILNNVKDHRLRILFRFPWRINKSYALNHFEMIERPVSMSLSNKDFPEKPVGCYPNSGFVMVKNKGYSVSFSGIGLKEYEILNNNTLAITLLRCVDWLSRDDLISRKGNAGPQIYTPDAQVQREIIFKYSLSAGYDNLPILQSYAFRQKNVSTLISASESDNIKFSDEFSFFDVQPQSVIISAVKRAEKDNGIIVRIFNIDNKDKKGYIRFYNKFRFKSAEKVNLLENNICKYQIKNNRIDFNIKGNEIITFKFKR